jgi:ATP-dependent Clp protease ATP-binding subunit ClpB
VTLSWDGGVSNHLATAGYDPAYGARPLRRLVQHHVVSPISRAILEGEVPNGSTVELTSDGQSIDFVVRSIDE